MSQFDEDNEWQRKMRDAILVPSYYFGKQYELIDSRDPRSKGGCDTILAGRRIDEKIVRWPKGRDDLYTAFALEVRSCTVPEHEREGWMKTNTVDHLLYCFANRDGGWLDCYLIDFPKLQQWFYSVPEDRWPLWTSDQINRTQCRVVPISEVERNVPTKRRGIARPAFYDAEGHFMHYCNCGKWGSFGVGCSLLRGKLGTWFCREHSAFAAKASL